MLSRTVLLLGLGYAASVVPAMAVTLPSNSIVDLGAGKPNCDHVKCGDVSLNGDQFPKSVATRQTTSSHDNTEALLINSFGDASQFPEQVPFEFFGPFTDIIFDMGSTNIKGIKVVDMGGKESEIKGVGSINPLQYQFRNNERISEITMVLSQDSASASSDEAAPYGVGVKFNTDAGNSFGAEPVANCRPLGYTTLKVGSGIIGRIHGISAGGTIYQLGIDMLDDISTTVITDLQYSGFTDNVAPSGPGQRISIGSLIINNLNSSSPQSVSLWTISTVTSSREISFSKALAFGASLAVTVKAGVSIPFVAEASTTATTTWGLTTTNGETNTSTQTKTDQAVFPVVCEAGKYCHASAFFSQYKLNVDISARFSATTVNNKVFNWVQNGTFDGADGTTVKTIVNEFNSVQ